MKNTQPCFLGCTLGLRSNLHIYKLCYSHRLPQTPLRDRRGCIIDYRVCVLLISLLHPVGCANARGRNSQETRKTQPHPHKIFPQMAVWKHDRCQKTSGIPPITPHEISRLTMIRYRLTWSHELLPYMYCVTPGKSLPISGPRLSFCEMKGRLEYLQGSFQFHLCSFRWNQSMSQGNSQQYQGWPLLILAPAHIFYMFDGV